MTLPPPTNFPLGLRPQNRRHPRSYLTDVDHNQEVLARYAPKAPTLFRYPYLHEGDTLETRGVGPMARRRVPRAVFDYLDGGAEGEVTLRENCRAFEDVTFRPRHAVSLSDCDLRCRVLGLDLSPAGRAL